MADVDNEDLENLSDLLRDGDYQPTRQDLLDLLNSDDIDDELKESLRSLLIGDTPQVFGGGAYLAMAFVLLVFLIIFFFGYKLYRSIKDKEKKREEKKKQKELKKKK